MFDVEDFNKRSIAGLMFLHEHLGFTFVIHNGRIEEKIEEGEDNGKRSF